MRIEDIIDVKKFPYVQPEYDLLVTPYGSLGMVRGLLSDGATGVKDEFPKAFLAHDQLYLIPQVFIEGTLRRLSKIECDLIYGWFIRQSARYLHHGRKRWVSFAKSYWQTLGLILAGPSWAIWNVYRIKERSTSDWWMAAPASGGRRVPDEKYWEFPTIHTKDAIYKSEVVC